SHARHAHGRHVHAGPLVLGSWFSVLVRQTYAESRALHPDHAAACEREWSHHGHSAGPNSERNTWSMSAGHAPKPGAFAHLRSTEWLEWRSCRLRARLCYPWPAARIRKSGASGGRVAANPGSTSRLCLCDHQLSSEWACNCRGGG